MKLKLRLTDTYQRVLILCILQGFCAVMGFMGESLAGRFVLNLTFLAQFALLAATLNFHMRALRNLLNTFWSITIILLLFYVIALTRNALILQNPTTAMWYLSAAVLLALGAWQISSPLYYPMVQWWEYDFRFRPDIRIWVEDGDTGYRARLTDLRRNAGCVVMFHAVPEGSSINVKTDVMNQRFAIRAEIVSRKEPILGRAFIYGVRFDTEDLEQRQRLKLLTNYWHETKKIKTRSKFDSLK